MFLKMPATFAILLLVVFIASCSSPGRNYTSDTMVETLETNILQDGSKMFVYRLRWPDEAVPSHIRVAQGREVGSPYEQKGVNIDRNTHRRLQENAGFVAARQGYCREGYLELDRHLERYHLWLKGECRETATAEDREKFSEKRTIPVQRR